MNQGAQPTDFRSLVDVIWRNKLLIISTVLVSALFVLWLDVFAREKQYQSEAEILITNIANDQATNQSRPDLDRTMRNELVIAQTRTVLSLVEAEFGNDPEVRAEITDGQDVMTITATDPDPIRASELATFYAATYLEARERVALEEFVRAGDAVQRQINQLTADIDALESEVADESRQLEASLLASQRALLTQRLNDLTLSSDLSRGGSARLISAPYPNPDPVSPSPPRDLVLAQALGLIIGVSLAYLRELVRNYSGDDHAAIVRAVEPAPILVELPSLKSNPGLSMLHDDEPVYNEAIRRLETASAFLLQTGNHKVIQILSSLPGEGKSTVAANLALALAERGHRVLLVDGDLRSPSLSRNLLGIDVDWTPGFSDFLVSLQRPRALPICTDERVSTLSVVPAGTARTEATIRLGTEAMDDFFALARNGFDYVVVDSPPVLAITDGALMGKATDIRLLVVGPTTATSDVKKAADSLRQLDVGVHGAVLNRQNGSTKSYAYGYVDSSGSTKGSGRSQRYRSRDDRAFAPRPRSNDSEPVASKPRL